MIRNLARLLVVGLILMLLPMAQGQSVPFADVTVHAQDIPVLMPDQTGDIPVEVTVGCLGTTTGAGSMSVTVTVDDAPSYLTVQDATFTFDGLECITSQATQLTQNGSLAVTAAADAMGFQTAELTVTASFDDGIILSGSDSTTANVTIGYLAGHTLDPDGDQTFQVTNGTYSFDLTVTSTANYKSMVMFEERDQEGGGVVDGLTLYVFDVAAGDREVTEHITFTAPEGDWNQTTYSFTNFSHCMNPDADCTPQLSKRITWTFVNAGGAGGSMDDGDGDSNDSPSLGAAFVLVGLVGAAAMVARRR